MCAVDNSSSQLSEWIFWSSDSHSKAQLRDDAFRVCVEVDTIITGVAIHEAAVGRGVMGE